jgi:hypothetical protein
MDYTLAGLARASKAKRRSLQLWADAGILRAYRGTERKGTGTHRLFGRDEVIIASIINVFGQRQVAIGEMQRLGLAIREFLDSGEERVAIEEAIDGKKRFLVVGWFIGKEAEQPLVFLADHRHELDHIMYARMGWEFTCCVIVALHCCLEGLKF